MNKVYKNEQIQEHHMINLAMSLAEKQLIDGTASSQLITHFLRLGETQQNLERERVKSVIAINNAKAKQIEEEQTAEESYAEALEALREYRGEV